MSSAVVSPSVFDSFKVRAEAVSAEVHRFPGRSQALAFLLDLLREVGVADSPGCHAVWADCRFLEGLNREQLKASVPGLGFAATREICAEAKVGISEMDWGKADTGTLVQDSTAIEQRLVSSLPPIHVALIATEAIVADLPALFRRINPRRAGYLAFITGPSRTADIERVLTIGVHGPERLVVVAYDSASTGSQVGGAR